MADWTITETVLSTWTVAEEAGATWTVTTSTPVGGGGDVTDADLAAAIAAGAVVLVNSHYPFPLDGFGAVFVDANTLNVSSPGIDVGTKFLLTEQTDSANDDIWIYQGEGVWFRQDPSALAFPARYGSLIAAQADFGVGDGNPSLLRVNSTRGVDVLDVDGEGTSIIAEYLVAVSAVDGSATTFQPIRRADDAEPSGIVPEHYLPRGGPLNVADWVGVYVVVPTPDVPADPSEYGRVYRMEAVGTPWTEVALSGNEPVIVVGGSDVGLPEWWVNRDSGPRPVQMAAHNVRVSRDSTVNTPDTLVPWNDLNEVTTVLARAIEWTFVGVGADWSWLSGLVQPSLWYTVNGDVAVPVTGTLPPLADFPVGRSVRVTSFTPQAVTIVDDETATTKATLGELDTYEFTSWGGGWMISRINPASAGALTVDAVSNVTGPTLLGRASGTGDSEELTAAEARTLLGQGWQTIDLFTFAGAESSRTVDVTGFNRVRVSLSGRSTRAASTENVRMTLNGNTGNVYGTNASALTSFWGLGVLPGALTNTDRGGLMIIELSLHQGLTKAGWVMNQQSLVSTSTVGSAVTTLGLFSTITDAVTTLELFAQLSPFAAGSVLLVEGA